MPRPRGQSRPRLVDVFGGDCCHPSCDAPASEKYATQVPLCEVHILYVYSATNRLLTTKHAHSEQYALLPSEQQQMPGPCPSCGVCGFLAVNLSDQVRCLNGLCKYEAWVDEFERLRRGLLFDAADGRNVVYYVKFRDRVKIGTTNNLKRRCGELQTVELLYGFEPGSYPMEQQRHKQFALYRTQGEWFEDNRIIRSHINEVCAIT